MSSNEVSFWHRQGNLFSSLIVITFNPTKPLHQGIESNLHFARCSIGFRSITLDHYPYIALYSWTDNTFAFIIYVWYIFVFECVRLLRNLMCNESYSRPLPFAPIVKNHLAAPHIFFFIYKKKSFSKLGAENLLGTE